MKKTEIWVHLSIITEPRVEWQQLTRYVGTPGIVDSRSLVKLPKNKWRLGRRGAEAACNMSTYFWVYAFKDRQHGDYWEQIDWQEGADDGNTG